MEDENGSTTPFWRLEGMPRQFFIAFFSALASLAYKDVAVLALFSLLLKEPNNSGVRRKVDEEGGSLKSLLGCEKKERGRMTDKGQSKNQIK